MPLIRFFPLVMFVLAACGGKDGPIEPIQNAHDITNLEPGQVRVLKPSDIANGIDLASVSDARDFLIVVGNTAQSSTENVANYVVRGNLGTGASLSAATSVAIAPQLLEGIAAAERAQAPQRLLESRIRAFERRALDLGGRRQAAGGSGLSFSRNAVTATVPMVGDVFDVKVPDGKGDNLCEDFIRTRAVVASVGQRAVLAVDTLDGDPLQLGFTQADYDAINAEFDALTYPTNVAYFGTPTDIDANQRIIILFTGEVNKLTAPQTPEGQGYVAGFFFAGDFFPPTATSGFACPQSNQAEIFYLLAPDELGLKYGNIRTAAAVRQSSRGTIAHEFQHMINAGLRYVGGVATDFEVSWLDEGLAHLGEEVVGRALKNFSDLQELSHPDLFPSEAGRNDYNAFFFQNLARFRFWLQRPDTSSGISKDAATHLSSRGAAWAFVRYSADHFSGSNPRDFTRRLVAGPDTGLVNFNKVTATPLDTVLAGWLVANYADNLTGLNITNARTQYRSFNMRSVMSAINSGNGYPLRVQALGGSGTTSLSGTNQTGTGTYYTLSVPANAGAKNVKVLDSGGTSPVNYPGAHVYVLRTR